MNYSSGNKNNHIKNERIKYINGDTKNINNLLKNKKKNVSIPFSFWRFSRIYQEFYKI